MASLYEVVNLTEQYPYAGIDSDEEKWRGLTGGRAKEELNPTMRDRMIKMSRYLWITNPLAHRIIEYMVAFTVGGGISFQAADPEVQKVLLRFWNDPVNNWNAKLLDRVRNLCLFGEQFYPVMVNPNNGSVRISYINPLDVNQTAVDPVNVEIVRTVQIAQIATVSNAPQTLNVINYNPLSGYYEGEIFAFAINKSPDATRGCSDLLPLIDWLGLYDEFLFNALERSAQMNSWLWDVTLEDASDQQITAWLKGTQAKIPKPGSIRAHNQKVKWEPISPKMGTSETSKESDLFKLHIVSGTGMPDYFFGDTSDVNRGGATETVEPTYKSFQIRQAFIRSMVSEIFKFVIDCSRKAGMLEDSEDFSFEIYMPRISLRDTQRAGGAMFRISQALEMAQKHKWITPDQAHQVFMSLIDQLGIGPEIRLGIENATDGGSRGEKSHTEESVRLGT